MFAETVVAFMKDRCVIGMFTQTLVTGPLTRGLWRPQTASPRTRVLRYLCSECACGFCSVFVLCFQRDRIYVKGVSVTRTLCSCCVYGYTVCPRHVNVVFVKKTWVSFCANRFVFMMCSRGPDTETMFVCEVVAGVAMFFLRGSAGLRTL